MATICTRTDSGPWRTLNVGTHGLHERRFPEDVFIGEVPGVIEITDLKFILL